MNFHSDSILKHQHSLIFEIENNIVTLHFNHKHPVQIIARKIFRFPIPEKSKLTLDAKTSLIWCLIDGHKTIDSIYTTFCQSSQVESTLDLQQRFNQVVTYFLQQKLVILHK